MAMRICPICKKEYDDDLGMICPYCGYVPEETEDAAAVNEIAEETEIIDESTESAEEEKTPRTDRPERVEKSSQPARRKGLFDKFFYRGRHGS